MGSGLKRFGVTAGILSSLLCFAGGIWIIAHTGFKGDDALWAGLGIYFIGKGVFVGPMLILTALKDK